MRRIDEQFEWDLAKDLDNRRKHGIAFSVARLAFEDSRRTIRRDNAHSDVEERFFCIGQVHGGILTVRYTQRGNVIRIIGAGYWRRGKAAYEEQNRLHE